MKAKEYGSLARKLCARSAILNQTQVLVYSFEAKCTFFPSVNHSKYFSVEYQVSKPISRGSLVAFLNKFK